MTDSLRSPAPTLCAHDGNDGSDSSLRDKSRGGPRDETNVREWVRRRSWRLASLLADVNPPNHPVMRDATQTVALGAMLVACPHALAFSSLLSRFSLPEPRMTKA